MPPVRRRTLRMRLTLLYGGLFLVTGTALLVFTNLGLWSGRSVTRTAQMPGGVPVAVRTSSPAVTVILAYSSIALVVMVGISIAIGWLVAGRTLRPLRAMTATARDLSASRLHERLAVDAPYDEFTELGATLDDLFDRLESSFEAQRHFVANASHELRTPLTAERALIQVALADPDVTVDTLRATCEQLLTLGEQQERMIDALLTLANSERAVDEWESVDLAGLARAVVAARRPEANRRGVTVVEALGAAGVEGDPRLIESLVANLVENAVRHNGPDGRVEVRTSTAAGRATLRVGNTGPVIPPDQVDRLFRPFQRLAGERVGRPDGYGLGLAIVRAIAHSHGAVLVATARAAGGLDIEVTFAGSAEPG